MKIKIDNEIIKSLQPCTDRYQNYLDHYSDFEGHIEDFLDLDHISHADKIWVSVRVMPRFLVECFAIDCAVAAADAAAAAAANADVAAAVAAYVAAANAAYVAAYVAAANAAYVAAANAANADVAAAYADVAYVGANAYAEKQRQIESIIYLIQNHEEN